MTNTAVRKRAHHRIRAAALAATLLCGTMAPVQAGTVLEAVLSLAARAKFRESADMRVTITQSIDTLRAVVDFRKIMPISVEGGGRVDEVKVESHVARTVTIRQVGPCKFDVENYSLITARPVHVSNADVTIEYDIHYTVDFAPARFDEVEVTSVINRYGTTGRVIALPGATYCPTKGVDFANVGTEPGACANRYNVGPLWPWPEAADGFKADIERVRAFCKALSLDRGEAARSPG